MSNIFGQEVFYKKIYFDIFSLQKKSKYKKRAEFCKIYLLSTTYHMYLLAVLFILKWIGKQN